MTSYATKKLELDHADEFKFRSYLAKVIVEEIKEREWSQVDAAKRLKMSKVSLSCVCTGNIGCIATFRLLEALKRIGYTTVVTLYTNSGIKKDITI